MIAKNPKTRVVFCPGDHFTNELIESIQTKTTAKFRKKYRQLDLLIIDDIQFIAGKNTVQEEFFHTFNSVASSNGQIILTSDRPPSDIKNLEDRLRSRFSGGLIVDIQEPDYELRSAILLLKAKDKRIELSTDIARLIAEQVTDSRALEGTLLSIYARSLSTGGIIDFAMVELFFQEASPVSAIRAKRRITPNDVIRSVATFYNLRPAHLKGPTRASHIALPRQIAMYLLRRELGLKHQEIASFLKRRDHTTILYGVEKVDKLMLDNPRVKEEIDRIAQSLSPST
jgi:chromosomal replication initiator protein